MRPTTTIGAPPANAEAAFVASLRPGGLPAGAVKSANDELAHLEPLSFLVPLVANDGVRTSCKEYMKELRAVRKVKEAALNQRGLTLAQTCKSIGDGIVEELVENLCSEMEDFFEKQAQSIVNKI